MDLPPAGFSADLPNTFHITTHLFPLSNELGYSKIRQCLNILHAVGPRQHMELAFSKSRISQRVLTVERQVYYLREGTNHGFQYQAADPALG
jgi:hypothetical protein